MPGPEREKAGQQPHREGAHDVDDESAVRKAGAQQPRCADVDAVAQGSADAGTEEDDQ